MKINLESQSDDIRIDIVPLIDVIFCILTFFILATLQFTRQQAISVDLPKASTSTTPPMRQMLIVRIDPTYGQVFVNDGVNPEQPTITREQLTERLQQYRLARPDGMMVLYAAKTASYNDVVQVLDQMRQVGGDRVALATIPESATQAPNTSPVLTPTTPGVPLPGSTGVAPYNPYSPPLPGTATPFNPNQPQLPPVPGSLPPQPGVNPVPPGTGVLTPTLPTPGATASPGQTPSGQN